MGTLRRALVRRRGPGSVALRVQFILWASCGPVATPVERIPTDVGGSEDYRQRYCNPSDRAGFRLVSQQGRQGSNLRPLVLETSALPAELRPWVREAV
jgi:hypothetical protein